MGSNGQTYPFHASQIKSAVLPRLSGCFIHDQWFLIVPSRLADLLAIIQYRMVLDTNFDYMIHFQFRKVVLIHLPQSRVLSFTESCELMRGGSHTYIVTKDGSCHETKPACVQGLDWPEPQQEVKKNSE